MRGPRLPIEHRCHRRKASAFTFTGGLAIAQINTTRIDMTHTDHRQVESIRRKHNDPVARLHGAHCHAFRVFALNETDRYPAAHNGLVAGSSPAGPTIF
jgi:hypothetical protein